MAHSLPTDHSPQYYGSPQQTLYAEQQHVQWNNTTVSYAPQSYVGGDAGYEQGHTYQYPQYEDTGNYATPDTELTQGYAYYAQSYEEARWPTQYVDPVQGQLSPSATVGTQYASYYDSQPQPVHGTNAPDVLPHQVNYPASYGSAGYPYVGDNPAGAGSTATATTQVYASTFVANGHHVPAKQSESGHDPAYQDAYAHPGTYVSLNNAVPTYAPIASYPAQYASATPPSYDYAQRTYSEPAIRPQPTRCTQSPIMDHLPYPEERAYPEELSYPEDELQYPGEHSDETDDHSDEEWRSPTPSLTSESHPTSYEAHYIPDDDDDDDDDEISTGPSEYTFITATYLDGDFHETSTDEGADGDVYDSHGRRGGRRGSGAQKPPKKEPFLACFFCRGRKIACHPQTEGDDRTCSQCAKRHLLCEYPLKSRRGQRKSNRDADGDAQGEEDTQSPEAAQSHGAE